MLIRCSQIRELLLDQNACAQIPSHQRIDLTLPTPSASAVPSLQGDEERLNEISRDTPEGQALYDEVKQLLERKSTSKSGAQPGKSLADLITRTPHVTSIKQVPVLIEEDLLDTESGQPPVSYMSPDQVDDYLYDIDASLGTTPHPALVPAVPMASLPALSDKELQVRNPNSVYNWLRENEPKIFLQDGEGSEKSSGKPGALRGAGKRASIPAPSKPDQVEFVEEDGLGYDISLHSNASKIKRKRDDDGGYRPKGGSSRPSKKKKVEASAGPSSSSTRRSRASIDMAPERERSDRRSVYDPARG